MTRFCRHLPEKRFPIVTHPFAAVDEDKTLSPTGKADKKREIAMEAIASFAKSKSLAAARDSVEHQVAKWNKQLGLTPKAPESIGDAKQ